MPPCKIDETGTPTAPDASTFGGDVAGELARITGGIDNPVVADTSWSWSFQLPSSCGPIAIPAFAPWLTEIDICPFQPVIHDLVSLLWISATIFGCAGMVYRALLQG
jgi:hypothetical protein